MVDAFLARSPRARAEPLPARRAEPMAARAAARWLLLRPDPKDSLTRRAMRRIAFLTSLAMLVLASLGAVTASAEEIDVRAARAAGNRGGSGARRGFRVRAHAAARRRGGERRAAVLSRRVRAHAPRWYWFDETAASRRLQLRLSYHALSRQYRLSTGLLQQNFATLEEALNVLQARAQLAGHGALRLAHARRLRGGGAHAARRCRCCPSLSSSARSPAASCISNRRGCASPCARPSSGPRRWKAASSSEAASDEVGC